jgi:predicted anti-sigma-YlaC factor YlaD
MTTYSTNREPQAAHLSEDQMRRYRDRTLTIEERQAAGLHLGGCGACRRALLSRMGPVALPEEAASLPEPLHLSYEQITAYVDGKLAPTDKDRAENHLFICGSCRREVEDIRLLDVQLASAVEEKAAVQRTPFLQRLARFFAAPGRGREFGLAFGAIIAGFFLLYGAGPAGQRGPESARGAARLMMSTAHAHPGLNVGGFLLVTLGLSYLAYSLWRRR